MWIVLFFLTMPIVSLRGEMNDAYIMTFIGQFLNPPYWFIRALLVYYLLSFFFVKSDGRTKLPYILLGLGILYFILYCTSVELSKWTIEDTSIKLIHYFAIFLFGIYLAIKNNSISYTGIHNYFILVLLIAAVYCHKYLMTKGLLPELQFIQQAAMYPIVLYSIRIARSPFILSVLKSSTTLSSVVSFIANHSLELYIVQETINHPVLRFNLPFPLNAIIFLCLAFVISSLTKLLADAMRKNIA